MTAAEPLAGDELERLLARYARVRLEPSPAEARRARAAVMEAAWRRRIAPVAARRGLFAGWGMRRLGVSLSAAVLAGLVLGTSAFASSRAGGPLYETRLALESLTLPAGPAARVDAQVAAAQARLAEAVEAAGRHDDPATRAALVAYDRVIAELAEADGPAAERALEAVRFHHQVLVEVAAAVADDAAAGLDRALANSEAVIARLTATTGGGSGNPNVGPGNNSGIGRPDPGRPGVPGGSPTPESTPTLEPTAKPDKPDKSRDPAPTPKPAKTEAPEATPKPTPTPPPAATPAPTDRPGRTPPPRKTPEPPGRGGGERTPPAKGAP